MHVGTCPACGTTPQAGFGHACVPKHTHAVTSGPTPAQSRRTICADCRWFLYGGSPFGLYEPQSCNHQNARHLVTGLPTLCRDRNTGHCPDFEAKP